MDPEIFFPQGGPRDICLAMGGGGPRPVFGNFAVNLRNSNFPEGVQPLPPLLGGGGLTKQKQTTKRDIVYI